MLMTIELLPVQTTLPVSVMSLSSLTYLLRTILAGGAQKSMLVRFGATDEKKDSCPNYSAEMKGHVHVRVQHTRRKRKHRQRPATGDKRSARNIMILPLGAHIIGRKGCRVDGGLHWKKNTSALSTHRANTSKNPLEIFYHS